MSNKCKQVIKLMIVVYIKKKVDDCRLEMCLYHALA